MRTWILALVALVPGLAAAADWPQYLGPHRTGVSDETGFVKGWTSGPVERWRVPVGRGYGSVAVVEGVVYVLRNGAEAEQLVALDAATGAERWSTDVGKPFDNGRGYAGTRSTPTVVGDTIVVLTGWGDLHAIDRATGAKRWSSSLTDDHAGAVPAWGYAVSPLVEDGKVYLQTGSSTGDGLVALDVATGAKVWGSGQFGAGYASPIHATLDGTDQIVFFVAYGVVGASPADGSILWKHPWPTDYDVNAATPVVLGSNRLFIASAYGVGGAALLVTEGKAVELWDTKRMKNKVSTSILVDRHLYGFNESRLTCLDATKGDEVWAAPGYGRGVLMAVDDHLLVQSEDCAHTLVKATKKGHVPVGETRRFLKGEMECWAAPALSDGMLYVRDHDELVAVEVRPVGPSPEG